MVVSAVGAIHPSETLIGEPSGTRTLVSAARRITWTATVDVRTVSGPIQSRRSVATTGALGTSTSRLIRDIWGTSTFTPVMYAVRASEWTPVPRRSPRRRDAGG